MTALGKDDLSLQTSRAHAFVVCSGHLPDKINELEERIHKDSSGAQSCEQPTAEEQFKETKAVFKPLPADLKLCDAYVP